MEKQSKTTAQILTDRLTDLHTFFQEQTGATSLSIYSKKTAAEKNKSTITELELLTTGLLQEAIQMHLN